ncbi:GNAT family N-acetyltransferase [Piscinibacter gummiphilus]|uniref:GNAT family N-acetyltransferase n=1 Tax=Piscinibacter gummiphilus TaxID=946333 RepID=A0ABZ0CZY5_9BURK|nr:GNAT family N-acetyltransferase [Piscinibacter gummiphilus]WOB10554.1 GNAT family N-acetyltransferase [Piscinibacter gummiphilus]
MREERSSKNYVIRVHDHPRDVDAAQWNALLAEQVSATPFMRHEYLVAMHESKSAVDETGWQPQFLTVHDGDALVAACPLYLKSHSYGEYVFDWAWADAYQRHGLRYYPKLLSAVPFTPVPGPRLLARDAASRVVLLRGMTQIAVDAKLSSAHVLFLDEADQQAAREAGWMMRSTVQFHWQNREPQRYADFADFLAGLQREKRKKIQQERRKVAEAGVTFTAQQGTEISREDWDFFYRCYTRTYREHHSSPYLTRDFFQRMADTMAENWLLFIARRDGQRIAASLIAIDPERRAAYGRYWGATEHISCLHFEACYYQPLAWCIAQGYQRFEGGAQGEHKMARGLLPVQTWSAHWLAHPQFAQAVADFLAREGAGVESYLDELNERQPFKA